MRETTAEILAIRVALILGVPALMFLGSFALPALGSPIVLLIGAWIGYLLPKLWLSRQGNGRDPRSAGDGRP
ncbi:MAG TPA: hypothetical protein VFT20_14835 [Candidatus Limnocylindrales bacterium]|nr:hypothetical protein [Candidatus Limnocylindrales bacterium]